MINWLQNTSTDTSDFVLKTKHQTDKTELEKKKFLMWLILLKKQNLLN